MKLAIMNPTAGAARMLAYVSAAPTTTVRAIARRGVLAHARRDYATYRRVVRVLSARYGW